MKKGQTQQVFIYMMVILVVGALLLIGFRSINSVLDRGCEVEYATFVDRLRGDLSANSRFGNRAVLEYNLPCNYEEICFATGTGAPYAEINSEVSAGTGNNIFLVRRDSAEPILAQENLDVPGNVLCVGAGFPRATFTVEGVSAGRIRVSE